MAAPALTEDVTDISLLTEHAQLFYADNREQNLPTNSGENLAKYRDLRVLPRHSQHDSSREIKVSRPDVNTKGISWEFPAVSC